MFILSAMATSDISGSNLQAPNNGDTKTLDDNHK
jgi:hypothetical protein